MLYNRQDIIGEVKRLGILPFFAGEVEGFSIEEMICPDYWFDDETGGNGVWDWKNDIIVDGGCAYGKFYRGKACFVSAEWFPHLVNVRREGFLPNADEQLILDTVVEHGSLLTREIKKLCGYTAPRRPRGGTPLEKVVVRDAQKSKPRGKGGFDGAITRLQMGCRLLSAEFEYSYTRDGRRYGWSVARLCTPEDFFGADFLNTGCTVEESHDMLLKHLATVLPYASGQELRRIVER